jgi:hypothetical protein
MMIDEKTYRSLPKLKKKKKKESVVTRKLITQELPLTCFRNSNEV